LKRRVGKMKDPASLMNQVEMSQMSEWTDYGKDGKKHTQWNQKGALKAVKEEKLSTTMDREGLLNELNHYKKFSLQQYETIKLLKVEIMKIKKMAAQRQVPAGGMTKSNKPPEWATTQDPNHPKKDRKTLEDEHSWLKQMYNESEEEKRILKANAEKYKKRAEYTLEKFNEIKAKEMQLIQMGEDKVKGDNHLLEAKYKKKIEKQLDKIKKLEEENNAMKLKQLEQNNKRQYRVDLEKSQVKCAKLEAKVKMLESKNLQNRSQVEIQKHIAESMYQDEKSRLEKEAEIEAMKSNKSDLNNLIINDDTSHSQRDSEVQSAQGSIKNVDLQVVADEMQFTVNKEQPEAAKQPAKENKVGIEPEQETQPGEEVPAGSLDYVSATLNAWNQCPTIVKK